MLWRFKKITFGTNLNLAPPPNTKQIQLQVGKGVKSMISLKTAQNFLKIKFLRRQQNFLQNVAQLHMNCVIDSFPYM